MVAESTQGLIGAGVAVVSGGVVAAVTVVGLISNSLSSDERPVDAGNSTISYGSTGG